MGHSWRTAWHGQDIVVYRDETEVDRINAEQIQRIVFVYAGNGDSPGDLQYAIVDTPSDCILFPADTGFSGRVNFERTDYWAARGCVYWAPSARVTLPLRMRRGRWWRLGSGPAYNRMARNDLAPLVDQWPLEGPQTWEQRKWRRIERNRPFSGRDQSTHKESA
jgi:hypothetical protein